MAENPRTPAPLPTANPYDEDEVDLPGNCYTTATRFTYRINMTLSYPTEAAGETSNPTSPPCVDYQNPNTGAYDNTVLDQAYETLAEPVPLATDYAWQYIAEDKEIIWAAPMAVAHLQAAYAGATSTATQPFAVDREAVNFVQNVINGGNPIRPFADITYITPCLNSSDHPDPKGAYDEGPNWLAWLVDEIGESEFWDTTTIIVTWDDWGGWYDHYMGPRPCTHALAVPPTCERLRQQPVRPE